MCPQILTGRRTRDCHWVRRVRTACQGRWECWGILQQRRKGRGCRVARDSLPGHPGFVPTPTRNLPFPRPAFCGSSTGSAYDVKASLTCRAQVPFIFSLGCRSLQSQRHSLCTFCRWQSSSKTKPKYNSTSFLRGAVHSTMAWVPDSIRRIKEALDQNPSPCSLTMAAMWAASRSWNLAFHLGVDWMFPQPVSLVVCHSSDTSKVHTRQRPPWATWTLEY